MITMKTTPAGIAKLCGLEKLELKAYQDSAGVWTIGYGCTYMDGRPVRKGDLLHDETVARYLLMQTLRHYENGVDKAVTADITNPQFDACVLLCYNIGVGDAHSGFTGSSVDRLINEEADMEDIEPHWLVWNKVHVNGVEEINKGLVYRRASEWALFSNGNYHYVKPTS